MTLRLKGMKDSSMSLMCWRAKGMPMIVIKSRPANMRCTNAVYSPPQSSQMMLQKSERQPVPPGLGTICLPNGHSTTPASLKHCNPQGIPTTVIQSTKPPTTYPRADQSPPKTSQMRFPIRFIVAKDRKYANITGTGHKKSLPVLEGFHVFQ